MAAPGLVNHGNINSTASEPYFLNLGYARHGITLRSWNHTEVMASVAPGLGHGTPSEVSHRFQDFLMEVPFAK